MAGVDVSAISLEDGATQVQGNEDNPSLLKLEEVGVTYALYKHEEATTIEEQFKHVGHLPGVLTKNLLIRVCIPCYV